MIQDYITSALIIDDSKNEVEKLIEFLEEQDVWVKHYTPSELDVKLTAFNNRKLIFLDLYLDDSKKSIENIALIRKYFKTIIGFEFGTYGIVLWTKHSNHFEEFCNKIFNEKNPFTKPLFIVSLDKTKYSKQGNYNGVLDELAEILEKDVSSSFFIEWNKAVNKGSDNTISTLYNLFDSNDKKNKHLESVLFELACSYTGIPEENIIDYDLQKDLVKSLMDTLQFEISGSYQSVEKLFSEPNILNYSDTAEEKKKVYAKLNSLLLLDVQNLLQNFVIPGNIYEIVTNHPLLTMTEVFYKKNKKNIKLELDNSNDVKVNKRIVIEITPPCDFAQNKKQSLSRVIGGIILDDDDNTKQYFNGDNLYLHLQPVIIDGFEKPQKIIFDYYRFQTLKEVELKDDSKFKLFAKAKDKLFADVLQKFSAHSARLGIAKINP